jgi:ketosteroid isomerase-like protein
MGTRTAYIKRPGGPRARAAGALLAMSMVLAGVAGGAAASDFDDMVAAERAFAADARARTTREAFLAALAPDAVVFDPGPEEGQRVWAARAPNKHRLEWAPAMAEMSASGDLGYTVSPWRFTPEGATEPAATGWTVTVWKKQADGHWRVLADHGMETPAAPFPEVVQRRGGVSLGAPPAWPVGIPELRSADLVPAGRLAPGLVSADFLRLRANHAPDGKAEGLPMDSHATRVDTGLAVSKAGDLAVTWGGGAGSPAWLRVWRRPAAEEAAGAGWRLALDCSLQARAPAVIETDH